MIISNLIKLINKLQAYNFKKKMLDEKGIMG